MIIEITFYYIEPLQVNVRCLGIKMGKCMGTQAHDHLLIDHHNLYILYYCSQTPRKCFMFHKVFYNLLINIQLIRYLFGYKIIIKNPLQCMVASSHFTLITISVTSF